MTSYGRPSRWAVALALGLACLIDGSTATAPAARAHTTTSAFELILEGRLAATDRGDRWELSSRGTFRSREPFCTSGTFVDDLVWLSLLPPA